MTKTLKSILDGVKASKVKPGSVGDDARVDYAPEAGDEKKWIAKHETETHDDRVGNDGEVYAGSNIKYSMEDPKMNKFGHKKGKDKLVYDEETVNEDLTPEDKLNHLKMRHNIASKFLNAPENQKTISGQNIRRHVDNEYDARHALKKLGVEVEKPKHRLVEENIFEKLTSDMTISDFIHDFVHSTDKRFAGKSRQERIKMATGAYYSMHPGKSNRSTNEDLAMPFFGGDIPKNKTDDTEEEISMVRGELKAIANKSMHILMSMTRDMHVEPWVQAKIAQAKELINSVHDYLLYNQEDEQTDGQMNFPGMDGNNIGPSSTLPGGGSTYNSTGMNA